MSDQIQPQTIAGMTGLVNSEIVIHCLTTPKWFSRDIQLIPELAVAGHDQANIMIKLCQRWGQ